MPLDRIFIFLGHLSYFGILVGIVGFIAFMISCFPNDKVSDKWRWRLAGALICGITAVGCVDLADWFYSLAVEHWVLADWVTERQRLETFGCMLLGFSLGVLVLLFVFVPRSNAYRPRAEHDR